VPHVGRLVGGLLIVAGLGLVAWTVADGAAHVALLLFVLPIAVSASPWFALGALLAFSGLLLLLAGPWEGTGGEPAPTPPGPGTPGTAAPRSGSERSFGGFVLIGPVPIVFGSARLSRRLRWALAALGAAVVVLAVLVLLSG
jgi:uncharacterized membrane protein